VGEETSELFPTGNKAAISFHSQSPVRDFLHYHCMDSLSITEMWGVCHHFRNVFHSLTWCSVPVPPFRVTFRVDSYRILNPVRTLLFVLSFMIIRRCIEKFPDWVDNEIYAYLWYYSLRRNTRGYGAKLTILIHEIAIQSPIVAVSCTICSFRSRRPVRKLWIHPRIFPSKE
jgi:hypothetical protein